MTLIKVKRNECVIVTICHLYKCWYLQYCEHIHQDRWLIPAICFFVFFLLVFWNLSNSDNFDTWETLSLSSMDCDMCMCDQSHGFQFQSLVLQLMIMLDTVLQCPLGPLVVVVVPELVVMSAQAYLLFLDLHFAESYMQIVKRQYIVALAATLPWLVSSP